MRKLFKAVLWNDSVVHTVASSLLKAVEKIDKSEQAKANADRGGYEIRSIEEIEGEVV